MRSPNPAGKSCQERLAGALRNPGGSIDELGVGMTHVRLLNTGSVRQPDAACGSDLCFGIDINDNCRYNDWCWILDAAGCRYSDYCDKDIWS